jgi:hypothetical protein
MFNSVCYGIIVMQWCYPKLLTPLLHHSVFNEEGGYVDGWVGARRNLRYNVPELLPDYSGAVCSMN